MSIIKNKMASLLYAFNARSRSRNPNFCSRSGNFFNCSRSTKEVCVFTIIESEVKLANANLLAAGRRTAENSKKSAYCQSSVNASPKCHGYADSRASRSS